ncbi:MAG: glycosyltransferase, partial [Candidatus Thorarchaeota archaeon]
GTAVIATNVAGTAEVLDNTSGILVSPGNTREICDAVVKLRDDQDLRNSLGKSGRKLIEEKYSWSKLGQRLLEVCENLVSKK